MIDPWIYRGYIKMFTFGSYDACKKTACYSSYHNYSYTHTNQPSNRNTKNYKEKIPKQSTNYRRGKVEYVITILRVFYLIL